MKDKGEIIIYQSESTLQLEVRMEDETVWLTQAQMVELFQSSKANISEHIKNIYESGELSAALTVRKFRTVRLEGTRNITRYLQPIITQYFIDNKSEIWLLFLIAHSKR